MIIHAPQASNMPKDNIDSAIKRGVEGKAGSNMEAVQVCYRWWMLCGGWLVGGVDGVYVLLG